MNDAGDNLLTHSTLTYDKHAEVCWRHLEGDVKHVVQSLAIPHDVIPLFNALQIHCYVFG